MVIASLGASQGSSARPESQERPCRIGVLLQTLRHLIDGVWS